MNWSNPPQMLEICSADRPVERLSLDEAQEPMFRLNVMEQARTHRLAAGAGTEVRGAGRHTGRGPFYRGLLTPRLLRRAFYCLSRYLDGPPRHEHSSIGVTTLPGPCRIAHFALVALFASTFLVAASGLDETMLRAGADTFYLDAISAEPPNATMDRQVATRDELYSAHSATSISRRTFFAAASRAGIPGGGGTPGPNVTDDHGDECAAAT